MRICFRDGKMEASLRLSCVHPFLLKEWKTLTTEICLNMKIQKDGRTWSGMGGLETKSISKSIKFKNIGGFLPEDVKVTKGKFIGKEKNHVLNLALTKLNGVVV